MNKALNFAPAGATHWCAPYYYRVEAGVVFKYEGGAWCPSLFDVKTLTSEPDCEKVK
ncbi:hypothetical protein vBAmaSR9Y1_38 [Alteromonas phage vB_AmaS-R9Y1]|nr:hypothetical protein vBAmaSR9Y1_38 [Alteromonas phage vB_AmaS-R9Y1]